MHQIAVAALIHQYSNDLILFVYFFFVSNKNIKTNINISKHRDAAADADNLTNCQYIEIIMYERMKKTKCITSHWDSSETG